MCVATIRMLLQGRPAETTFQNNKSKATTKLDNWKANSLSKEGRTISTQSYLKSLPAPAMQCFHFQHPLLTNFDRLHRNFFWKR